MSAPAVVETPKNVMFWSGALAGMASATSTHFLDVGKVARQIGRPTPCRVFDSYWLRGLPFGAVAQGQRFATTLILDATLQAKLKERGSAVGYAGRVVSFGVSMFSAGLGEFLANPPVAVKNYQIAHNVPSATLAMSKMYKEKNIQSFFRGVTAGVFRKSLANAVVLQTIAPTKAFLSTFLYLDPAHSKTHAALSGFLAGGLTGGIAEVATNPVDRIKTLMQANPRLTLREACLDGLRRPFSGAGYAFVRKGSIRAINWGVVGLLLGLYQNYHGTSEVLVRSPTRYVHVNMCI